jgi:uncharacterized protein (TIGR00369 family)
MNKTLFFLQQQVGKEAAESPSPFMRWLNPVMLSAEEGALSFRYRIRKEMTNPFGTLHGGISAGIIDDAIGATVFSLGDDAAYKTINLNVDYFAAAVEGDSIIAVATILKRGKQLIHAQCELWNEDQSRLLAKGQSNLIRQ